MKIVYIVTGSGDSFYCGNCFRDYLQGEAMRKAGHEVIIMPMYLPLRQILKADTPLFFPAISMYMSQKYCKNKPIPKWIRKVFDSNFSLNIAASFAGSTTAKGMEDMTNSMINGDDFIFRQYAAPMLDYIEQMKPDVVHIASSLIIGVAKAIKERMNMPVVCSLKDEEVWIDCLEKQFAQEAWQGIKKQSKYVDCFVTNSNFYKNYAADKIATTAKLEVIYPSVDSTIYASEKEPEHPTIGFMYHMNELNGLDILAEAFVKLKKEDRIKNLRLKVGGGYTATDKGFIKKVRAILKPYWEFVDWTDKYLVKDQSDFYKQISLICVPLRYNEAVGLFVCEAFAAGRPVVAPSTGSFPEIIDTGGLIYEPNSSEELADTIDKFFGKEGLINELQKNTLHLASTRYNQEKQAEELYSIYQKMKQPKEK